MKKLACVICAIYMLCAVPGCASRAKDSGETTPTMDAAGDSGEKIGVYDSRVIAIAFAGCEMHERSMDDERAAYNKAKAEGDGEMLKEAGAAFEAAQKRMHHQAFGTASVDNILTLYPEAIQALRETREVLAIISKWDEAALAGHPDAARIDLTDALVDMIQPSDKQRRASESVRDKKPLTEAEIDRAHH